MAKKVALLIGVSEYGEGIPSLSAPLNDVAAMKRVLENSEMGGFDEVQTLPNPDATAMQIAIQQIFDNCRKDDLVLLFFSGHGITDDNNRLYLATKGTSKDFYKATSVPASFVHDVSLESYAKRQAIILDCCYSGAFAEGWQTKSVGLNLQQELGGEGRVVLTSSTATQTSFQQEGGDLSLYTKYFVEGIEKGTAGKKDKGKIYAYELHDYAKAKVQEEKPKQKPGIIIDKEGFNIILSQALVDDPELDFRQLAEKYATEGQITVAGNYILQVKQQELGITKERSDEIVNEVLAPYRKRLENIELFKEAFAKAVEQEYPLSERLLNELKDLEDVLGIEDKDIAEIQKQILAEKEAEYQRQQEVQQQEQEQYKNKLQQYKQEFLTAVEDEYPLSDSVRDQINILQKSLEIRAEDIRRIEQPILAAKYQEKLIEEEKQRQHQQEWKELEQKPKEKLLAILSKYKGTQGYLLYPDISNHNQTTIRNKLRISKDEEILAFVTTTMFGRLHEGIAFTNKGIIWLTTSWLMSESVANNYGNLPYKEFHKVSFRGYNDDIYFGEGLGFNLAGWAQLGTTEILNLLNEIKNSYQA